MNDIDKFFADKCGVTLDFIEYPAEPEHKRYERFFYIGFKIEANERNYEWSIQDPRCRQIIREKFNVTTYCEAGLKTGKWDSEAILEGDDDFTPHLGGNGDTIKEAELACLQAIYESEHEEK